MLNIMYAHFAWRQQTENGVKLFPLIHHAPYPKNPHVAILLTPNGRQTG
jgi:hypothetical protein